MSLCPTRSKTALGLVVAVSLAACGGGDREAPRSSCFAQDPNVDWIHGDTGSQLPGTSRREEEGFTLCSDAIGVGSTSDNFHYVGQSAPGDFSMMAVVTHLDTGEASLVFSPLANDAFAPRVRVSAKKTKQGYAVEVASRSAAQAPETVLATASASKLPLTLSLTRGETTLHAFADDTGTVHELASVDATTGELATGGVVLLTQASGNQGSFTQATFARVTYEASLEEAEPECSDSFLATPAAPLTIHGKHMGRARSVKIGGVAAAILTQSDDYVVVQTPTVTGPVATVAVRTATQTRYMRAPLAVAHAQATAPALSDIVNATGDRVLELRAGDDAYIEGENLPLQGLARVWLGRNEVAVEADSTATRLHVRVPAIAADEPGCPRIFIPSGPAVRNARYGDVYGVRESFAPHLCPTLIPTASADPPRVVTVSGGLNIAIPRSLAGGERLSFLWAASAAGGASRGARYIDIEVPRLQLATADDRYAKTLDALAKLIEEQVNGGETTTPCACEVSVLPDAQAGTLLLAPCLPVPVGPDEPQPAVPGLPTDLESNKLIWSLLDVAPQEQLPPPPSCNDVTPESDPRRFSWCEFMRVVLPKDGFPRFESFDPLNRIYAQNQAPSVGEDNPLLRPVGDKYIMLEPGLATRYVSLGYASPCGYAARTRYCGSGFVSNWMPRFKTGDRMVKLFWVVESSLGSGMDKSRLYSYQPPDSPRFYLVGMHIAVARFDMFSLPEGYFRWITLWVPSTGVNTPRYNTHCGMGLGHNADIPDGLLGTGWDEFVMCSEVDGATTCGNPWGPADECSVNGAAGCKNCHEEIGHVEGPTFRVESGWLATPRNMNTAIEECRTAIKSGEEDHSDLVVCDWSDISLPSDPFLD